MIEAMRQIKTKTLVLAWCVLIICASSHLQAQVGAHDDLLPEPTVPLNCATVLRYVDDGVIRADRANATLFLVVRVKDRREARLAATRTKYLNSYFRSQGINSVEVLADLSAARSNIIDVYLDGDKLYSLPIKKNETMKWANC